MSALEGDRRPAAIRAAADLAAFVRETVAANASRDVLHLRMAGLSPTMRRPHHQRMLRDALWPALSGARTRVFDLPNGDVVAVAPPPALALETTRLALARTLEAAAQDAVRSLRLPEAAAQVLAAAAESLGLDPAPEEPDPGPARPPVTSAQVAAAERALARADLDPVTARQTVCRMDPEGAPAEPLWEDRRIAWPALSALVLEGADTAAAAALRRRLARLAEARMLAEIGRPAAQVAWKPVGLPLTPATLASPAFDRFDAGLPAGRRREITIGFRPADVLADPAGFIAARDLARPRGYRLALDDAPAGLLAVLPVAQLGVDMVRLSWSPELPMTMPPGLASFLADGQGPEAVVLVGVDRAAAIAWGWEVGIRRFQGPLVEKRRRGL
ncbi:EAL domain-containing protein [Falsiroseomonas ponticola]|uniref:hypothetical protein n=1 Tax=Falsiroseomonas ponticola TaxID=2786951 RepID=UPI00193243D9|nr:hypothetical protein [Roseomonas ponticola]